MSLYNLILWNQVDILQKHLKKDHVHMPLWDEASLGFYIKYINISIIYFKTYSFGHGAHEDTASAAQ